MKKLTKSQKDRVLFGVCGGISKYLNIDSPLMRLLFIIGTIFSGTLLLWVYIILALVLKTDEE
jgi:phage shock protein PspC (stress-responsive transcriptional regulator)